MIVWTCIAVLFVTALNTVTVKGNCKDDYKPCVHGAQGTKTWCIRKLQASLNVDGAKKQCGYWGMSLPEIHSWKQQREMQSYLKEEHINEEFWLDGTYKKRTWRPNTQTFAWATMLFPPIDNMKLDSSRNSGYGGECVVMDPKDQYVWKTARCTSSKTTICVSYRQVNLEKYGPQCMDKFKDFSWDENDILMSE